MFMEFLVPWGQTEPSARKVWFLEVRRSKLGADTEASDGSCCILSTNPAFTQAHMPWSGSGPWLLVHGGFPRGTCFPMPSSNSLSTLHPGSPPLRSLASDTKTNARGVQGHLTLPAPSPSSTPLPPHAHCSAAVSFMILHQQVPHCCLKPAQASEESGVL